MPESNRPLVERVARVLAGAAHSSNAEGSDPSAAEKVDRVWPEHLNQALAVFGVAPIDWLNNELWARVAVIASITWRWTGYNMVIILAGLQAIPQELYEAARIDGAGRWQTFTTVSLPLMRPGLANAFLLGFIESLADFGNPLVLGGSYNVLSTEIFFAIVGAQYDQGRAAVLSIVLLAFTLSAFYAQRRWLGRKSYATVTGKGDAGLPMPLPDSVRRLCFGVE